MALLKDSVISGSLRVTDAIYTLLLQTNKIQALTAKNGTTYGLGTDGQTLHSDGTNVYWGENVATRVGTADIGSGTQPIWVDDGTLKATTYALKATVNDGTQNRLAYYSGAKAISSGNIVSEGNYISNVTYLTVNADHQTSYTFKVNGTANITSSALINNITIQENKVSSGNTLYLNSAGSTSIIFSKGGTNAWRFNADGTAIHPETDNAISLGLTAQRWKSGYFDSSVYIGANDSSAPNSGKPGTFVNVGYIELVASTPYIDFHYNKSTADYTGRIINDSKGAISIYGTAGSWTYNSRTSAPILYVNGLLGVNGTINTSNYILVNGKDANTSSIYLYANAAQYGRWYVSTVGTASNGTTQGTLGEVFLTVGNSTARAAATETTGANNARGRIRLYGTGTNYTDIIPNPSGDRTFWLQAYAGDMYAAHVSGTGKTGDTTQPVYVAANGRITATTYSLSATINASGNANRIAYYSGTNAISAGAIVTEGNYLSNMTYLTVNADHQTTYRFKVNGASYFSGNATHNGIVYFANATTYYINNSGTGNLNALTVNSSTDGSSSGGALKVVGGAYIGKQTYMVGQLTIANTAAGAIKMTRSGGPNWLWSTANTIAFCANYNASSIDSTKSALRINTDTVDGYNDNYAHLGSADVQWKDVSAYKYIVNKNVTLEWSSDRSSLDFVFA